MLWLTRLAALVLFVGFSLPLLAEDVKKADVDKKADDKKADDKKADDKKADDKKTDDKKEEKDKYVTVGVVNGKITQLNEDKKTLKIEVSYQNKKLNEGEATAYQNSQNKYQQAAFNRNLKPQDRFNQMAQAQQEMAQHAAKLYTIETKKKEMEFQQMEDVKIRTSTPPIAFDDNGKAKKYTKKELDELKGDPKLPGYTAEAGTLATGQMVQATIVVHKKDHKPMKPIGGGVGVGVGAPKPKDVGLDPDKLTDNLPLISIIVVVQPMGERN